MTWVVERFLAPVLRTACRLVPPLGRAAGRATGGLQGAVFRSRDRGDHRAAYAAALQGIARQEGHAGKRAWFACGALGTCGRGGRRVARPGDRSAPRIGRLVGRMQYAHPPPIGPESTKGLRGDSLLAGFDGATWGWRRLALSPPQIPRRPNAGASAKTHLHSAWRTWWSARPPCSRPIVLHPSLEGAQATTLVQSALPPVCFIHGATSVVPTSI